MINKNFLVVEFSDELFSNLLIKINKKKNFIHTWISSRKINNENFNYINNQNCINGTNFSGIILNKNENKIFIRSLDYKLAKNMLKRQMPLSKMRDSDKKKFINYLILNWSKYLKENKIKKVIFYNTPHLTYSYIIYSLCKKFSIETKILENTKYLQFYYFINKVENNFAKSITNSFLQSPNYIKNYLNQFNNGKNIKTHSELERDSGLEFIKIFFRSFFIPFIKKQNIYNYFFKKQKIRFHNYSKYLPYDQKSFHTKFIDNLFYFKSFFICKTLKDEYKKKSVDLKSINKNFKYILFSANFQPEKSTSPDSHSYYDQLKILKILNNFCNKHKKYKILYKEHPSQFLVKRFGFMEKDKVFYNKIYKLNNLIFLNINTSTKNSIEASIITATATSETALQSILLNIPSIIFGSIWFSRCKGVYLYKKNLDKLIFNALKTKTSHENVKKFLLGLTNKENLNLNIISDKLSIKNFLEKNIF